MVHNFAFGLGSANAYIIRKIRCKRKYFSLPNCSIKFKSLNSFICSGTFSRWLVFGTSKTSIFFSISFRGGGEPNAKLCLFGMENLCYRRYYSCRDNVNNNNKNHECHVGSVFLPISTRFVCFSNPLRWKVETFSKLESNEKWRGIYQNTEVNHNIAFKFQLHGNIVYLCFIAVGFLSLVPTLSVYGSQPSTSCKCRN